MEGEKKPDPALLVMKYKNIPAIEELQETRFNVQVH